MKVLSHGVDIAASAERAWACLTDFAAFPTWNPFIREAHGDLVVGARLTVRIQPPGRAAMTFRPTVLAVDPPLQLCWLGHLLFPGLFDGEHAFTIEPRGPAACRLVQSESFRGILVPVIGRSVFGPTADGFAAMNLALKARAGSGNDR